MPRHILFIALAALLLVGCRGTQDTTRTPPSASAAPPSDAGLTDRPIKALAPERVEELLAGRGAGYALAAELNHYPGPPARTGPAHRARPPPGAGTGGAGDV